MPGTLFFPTLALDHDQSILRTSDHSIGQAGLDLLSTLLFSFLSLHFHSFNMLFSALTLGLACLANIGGVFARPTPNGDSSRPVPNGGYKTVGYYADWVRQHI